jgi:hypothetical protein
MTVFQGAVDATFAAFGIVAVYTPAGGDPVSVRVIARRPDAIVGFGETRIHAETAIFELRASEGANPRPDDQPTVAGDTLVVQGEPERRAVLSVGREVGQRIERQSPCLTLVSSTFTGILPCRLRNTMIRRCREIRNTQRPERAPETALDRVSTLALCFWAAWCATCSPTSGGPVTIVSTPPAPEPRALSAESHFMVLTGPAASTGRQPWPSCSR